MSRKYKIRDQDKLHFVTFTTVQWMDVFIRNEYKNIFLDSIRFCQQHKNLDVWAYVIMTSHIHMIIGRSGDAPLQDIIRDVKKFTAVKILEAIENNQKESRRNLLLWVFKSAGLRNPNNTNYQFWQQHSHPIELNSNRKLENCLYYIHMNPVVAGIVLQPEHYLYSSAMNYAGRPEAMLEVLLM